MTSRMSRRAARRSGGFTLLEAVYAIMIEGLGIAALMQVFASGTKINAFGDQLSKSVFLAEELRSMTDNVAFADLLDYNGTTYNGVDANGNAVAGLTDFQQQLTVQAVNPATLTLYVGANPAAMRLTARVRHSGSELTHVSWLRMKEKIE
jgi:hypothetical protein